MRTVSLIHDANPAIHETSLCCLRDIPQYSMSMATEDLSLCAVDISYLPIADDMWAQ
jgi:hypothetical protein